MRNLVSKLILPTLSGLFFLNPLEAKSQEIDSLSMDLIDSYRSKEKTLLFSMQVYRKFEGSLKANYYDID
jgi:hypothetical protein